MGNNVLVIGALGQDGSFMCDILVEQGYSVFGLIKETSNGYSNPNVKYIKDDLMNIKKILSEINPIHVYNFMGVTDVFDPWSNADKVYENNFLIPIKIIEAIKEVDKNIKFLQASSSLVFGTTPDSPQNELSQRTPIYHYGIAKNFTDSVINTYRERDGLKIVSVILFPHESERRGEKFLSKKIVNQVIEIKLGVRESIEIGDVEGYRDVGYAKDYMEACLLIMNSNTDGSYVIGSGTPIKTLDFIVKVFNHLGVDIKDKLVFKTDLKRGVDLSHLIADNTKLKGLGWEPKHNIDDIIKIMINDKLNKND